MNALLITCLLGLVSLVTFALWQTYRSPPLPTSTLTLILDALQTEEVRVSTCLDPTLAHANGIRCETHTVALEYCIISPGRLMVLDAYFTSSAHQLQFVITTINGTRAVSQKDPDGVCVMLTDSDCDQMVRIQHAIKSIASLAAMQPH